ncbi:MAG: hypothetical protein HOC70_17615 [Gammaproteobacteria bacterium]|jgi:hypothetical protein|nr:hypothetical protein [Gammaproteobacteria bacterium]MBT4495064.1 hypothetical protein [Gammaproteobacteria bacterium]MBT7370554.1 hypothetical protein [Gammaproteobacteria bacterium]
MKSREILLASALMIVAPAVADTIMLSDGSTIQGKVISLNNGQYQVQTQSLGVVSLSQSQVNSISSGSASTPQQNKQVGDAGASALQSMQANMANDPGIMSTILQLQNHPDMQAVLRDPEVMQAVQSFDLQTLSSHPKIKKLMQNAEIKRIQGKLN